LRKFIFEKQQSLDNVQGFSLYFKNGNHLGQRCQWSLDNAQKTEKYLQTVFKLLVCIQVLVDIVFFYH